MLSALKHIIKRNSVSRPPSTPEKPRSIDSERSRLKDPPSLKDYWETRLKENFGLHGAGFIGLGRGYNNWLYKVRRKVFISWIKSMRLDFSDKDILDVGCGTGFYVGLWKNQIGVRHITGIDITNIAIEKLKGKFQDAEFYRADVSSDADIAFLIRTKEFDVVSAFDVLFHIVDDNRYQKALKNIHSMLKPNGIFVFSDNFIHGPTIRSTYQVSRSLSHIEKTLIENGFDIIQRRPMFVLMNTPVDTTRRGSKRMWRYLSLLLQRYGDTAGIAVGCFLYPIELLLVSLLKETASTEIMVCRKRN
ncbi:MAG: class I SAM-dependent methyltransferase [Candidatus Nitrosopolaris sp.]